MRPTISGPRTTAAAPRTAVAGLYREATAHWAAGRVPQAVEGLRRIVRIDSENAEAHHNLGGALLGDGQIAEAVVCLQRAVALRPGHEDAWIKLASALEQLGRETDAANAFERLARMSKDVLQKRLFTARALNLRNAPDEAEVELRRALASSPTSAMTHGLLGQLLLEKGRFGEAEPHLLQSIEVFPDVFQQLATSRRMGEDDRPLLERMTTQANRPEVNTLQRASIHFGLGKAHDDLGEYDEAIGHYDQANALRGRSARLDRAGLVDSHDRAIRTYTRASLPPEVPASFTRQAGDETPILILGMPRSGTTLVEQIVSSHPMVAAAGELSFWRDRKKQWRDAADATAEISPGPTPISDPLRDFLAARPVRSAAEKMSRLPPLSRLPASETIDPAVLQAAGRDYVALLRRTGPGALRVTDKALFNFERIGLIRTALPGIRIIHCHRTPVDTCLSIFFTNYKGRQAWSRDDLVFQYRQYERLMAYWRSVLAPDRFIEVDYANTVADREAQTRRLIDFCGLPWSDACLAPEKNTRVVKTASVWQARQPTYTRSLERWRRYEPWLGELRELLPEGA